MFILFLFTANAIGKNYFAIDIIRIYHGGGG